MVKVAVVTGATSGIGLANVELLLKKNINVIALGRSHEKNLKLAEKMNGLNKSATLDVVLGDLSDIKKTRQAIQDIITVINEKYQGKIDILMNIAGIVSSGLHLNDDGNEITFHTNHLAVFMLSQAMVPYLEKSDDPRVLVVSSLSHYRARINFNNIQNIKMYNILKAYQRSKLYNVFFVKEFFRKYPQIPIYAIDPGLVKTEIGLKNTSKLAAYIWKLRVSKGTDAYYPAQFMVNIATENEYKVQAGQYFKEGKLKKSAPLTYREDITKRLWEYSESLLK